MTAQALALAFLALISTQSLADAENQSAKNLSDYISLNDATGITNSSQYYAGILAIGDVNDDGFDDILTGALTNQDDYPSVVRNNKPILLVYDPQTQKYKIDLQFISIAPKMIWPRRAEISDLDGDGDKDIFIAGHGTDGDIMHCGEQNVLIERTNKNFIDSSAKLPQVSDYTHGVVLKNLDSEPRKVELLIFNSPFLDKLQCPKNVNYRNRSYGFHFHEEKYREIKLSASSSDINLTENSDIAIHSATSDDLNGDQLNDIIIGTDHALKILMNAGNLHFSKGILIRPPERYYTTFDTKKCLRTGKKCNTPYSDFILKDYDNDGDLDIIASLLNQQSDLQWLGSYLQVVQNNNGKWLDVTDTIIPEQSKDQNKSGRWCFSLDSVDIDVDGYEDLICSQYGRYEATYGEAIWLHRLGRLVPLSSVAYNKDGEVHAEYNSSALKDFLSRRPQNIRAVNLNGKAHLVGVITSANFSGFQIVGLRLSKLSLSNSEKFQTAIPNSITKLNNDILCTFALDAEKKSFSTEVSREKYVAALKLRGISATMCNVLLNSTPSNP